ncbi:MAG: transketolase [Acidimicrobiales bacterium]
MSWQPRDLAPDASDLDAVGITTLRMLAVDGVEAANSGHPGLPLGMAPTAWTLWRYFLRFDPTDHDFALRDRFVLSAGHGSMLLYSLLHLFGFDVTIDDLKGFRSLGSRTPGHPEYGMTDGVETSTGPLGQGVGNAVGMAIAARTMASRFGVSEGATPRIFAICSDGDLMEGVSNEASSLAGHLRLGNLVLLYDDNHISIDGSTGLAFTENVPARYEALGWKVYRIEDGNDHRAIRETLDIVATDPDPRPKFVAIRTVIGFGAPTKQGTSKVHGAALGSAEITALRERFGWPESPFYVPAEVAGLLAEVLTEKKHEAKGLRDDNVDSLSSYMAFRAHDLGSQSLAVPTSVVEGESVASRVASKRFLQEAINVADGLIVGTADLGESTGLDIDASTITPTQTAGNYVHYGVREHGMGAVMNGIALFGGFHAVGSTFLVFSDYMRGSIRLAAIMSLPVTYVFTHDSIGVGEDGPTHQPIEQIAALRLIPNLRVIRPADARETESAWRQALSSTDHPVALILSRQGLPDLGEQGLRDLDELGARVLRHEEGACEVTLVGSGSEVGVLDTARTMLSEAGVRGVRVVSMPERERFLGLDETTRARVVPRESIVITLEAGVTTGWERVIWTRGRTIGVNRFGESGKGPAVFAALGITPQAVVDAVLALRS